MAWRMLRGEQGKGLTCSIANPNVEAPEFNNTEKQLVFEHPTADHMQLLGTAKIMDQQIPLLSPASSAPCSIWRLTTAESSQCGGIFRQESMNMIVSKGMETEFAIRLTNSQGGPAFGGADGMAFVIQAGDNNGAQLGEGVSGGCELGYGGIKNSLAIEFDTYDSSDRCADPSPNHISIHARLPPYGNSAHHDHSLKHTSAIPALNSGDWIYCRIRYLAASQTLEVALKEAAPSLSSSSLASSNSYITVLTVNNLNLADYVSSQGSSSTCWVGFTASTGGLAQNHDVSWFSLYSYN
ncbi:concanavalin A-like lectin/glucanase domain-containing protein [Absidia repens]|uniref:Concanavalin A-like lectin/glucanase domain-containing protein n=1 Tax=Absidia repens TaxID=90262 RepID=A0A1X2IWX3_9FUNG|nr:concanavalin A-like lectin/glucanase domain-containing protein [Absidia repens]